MFLTELAELIKDSILAAPPEKWVGPSGVDSLIIGTQVPVRLALDPLTATKDPQPALFVIPGYCQYTNAGERKNQGIRFSRLKIITLAFCFRMMEMDAGGFDVTSWEEGRKLLDLKEILDEFMLKLDLSASKVSISDSIETDPPEEINLDNRYFLATTVIGYDSC